MSGYVRQRAAEIVLGAVARASDIATELDQVQAAFNSSTGHTHSGVSGEGAPITVIGPAQDLIVTTTIMRPRTDNTIDLGTPSFEYKDGYFDGTLHTDAINLDGTIITSTASELNILDGATVTVAELNILDGVTATTAEINILDGVTATTAELNILDGVTATTAEINYIDGVTSSIQTQLDAKPNDAEIPALYASVSAGAIGSLIFANCGAGVSVNYGTTVAGSTLTPAGFSQAVGASERADIDVQLSVQSGTWRSLGYTPGAGGGAVNATLFMRIS